MMAKHPSEMISAALTRHGIEHQVERGKTRTTIRVPFNTVNNIMGTDGIRQHLGMAHRPEERNFVPNIYLRLLSSIRGLPKTHGITIQHGPAGRPFVESELRIRMINQPLASKKGMKK